MNVTHRCDRINFSAVVTHRSKQALKCDLSSGVMTGINVVFLSNVLPG